MAAIKEEEESLRLLKEHGATLDRISKRCRLWRFPTGERVGLPLRNSTVEPHAWKNTLAEIKRILRAHEQENEGEDMDLASEQKKRLEASGVYLGEVSRKTVVVIGHQGVIPATGLAVMLGFDPESVEAVKVQDAEGKEIVGPITVLINVREVRE